MQIIKSGDFAPRESSRGQCRVITDFSESRVLTKFAGPAGSTG
jgi:hypothetical protein